MEEVVRGKASVRLFTNDSNNFGIFKIKLKDNSFLTIKGSLANLELERNYEFNGNYVEDPRYGLQFNVTLYTELLPNDEEMVVKYLSGPLFPGIGIKTAQKIVDTYGNYIVEEIQKDMDFILEVDGLSRDKANSIVQIIHENNIQNTNVNWLMSKGLSGNQIHLLMNFYEDAVVEVLSKNPFQPLYDMSGIGFKTLDTLCTNLNFESDHPLRIEAKVLDLYKKIVFSKGDSFIYEKDFLDYLNSSSLMLDGYKSLLDRGELVLEDKRLYHYTQYESETIITDFIHNFSYPQDEFLIDDISYSLSHNKTSLPLDYDVAQIEAINSLLQHPISIITGGPGTGKSTLLSGVVGLLHEEKPWLSIALCAPTGRAAKRLESLTNIQATTIHSLIKWDLETNTFGHNEDNPIDIDVLIIDEFSMVDTWLLARLLVSLKSPKKIVFVGDKDQLPSVSSGYVLGDLIDSKILNTIILERNYRQEKGSEVINLALEVNRGEAHLSQYSKDVKFYELNDMDIKHGVLQLIEKALKQGYVLNDIQVLAPMYQGIAGIDLLNHYLQGYLNPPSETKQEIIFGSKIYREGDKVLQLKNQPDDFVFNGDIGEIVAIIDQEVYINFSGNDVIYGKNDLININHAYCISVHKAQGSEYPIVILIASHSFNHMLSRKLYYTGVSRSSRYLFILGQENAFVKAAKTIHESKRLTSLKSRLNKEIQ